MNIKEKAEKALTNLRRKLLSKGGLKIFRRTDSPYMEEMNSDNKLFSCSICDYKCKSLSKLKQHEKIPHIGKNPFKCKKCNKKFNNANDLKTHEKSHSIDNQKKPGTKRKYNCSKCSKSFSASESLKAHEMIHTGDKPYSCFMCNYKSNDQSNLKKHERSHIGEKRYECSVCNIKFLQNGDLKKHNESKVHIRRAKSSTFIDVSKSESNVKTFLLPSTLIRDKTCSTESFSCPKCKKKFTLKFALMKHEAKHNVVTFGGRPFGCQHCGKTFTDPDSWQRHERLLVKGGKRLCVKKVKI